MNSRPVWAILAGLALLVPTVASNAYAQFLPETRNPTSLELDQIPECLNTMQCNAEVFTGNQIEFTGVLTDDDGRPLPNREVQIIALIPTPELIVLATATTDIDGMYSAEWTVKLSKQKTAFQDVTRQFQTESLEVFAQFNGDDNMAPAKSGRLSMTVTVNTISTMVNSDKNLYNEGDMVTVFINFIESNDEFIDPDTILATWNNQPIMLEKKAVGSYTFIIDSLEKKHQQIIIVPHKEGFNSKTAFLTLIVEGLR